MLLKDKIKQLRKDRGLTQASLGKLINKSSQLYLIGNVDIHHL